MEDNKTKKKTAAKKTEEKKEQTTRKQKTKVRLLHFKAEYASEKTEEDVKWLN